MQVRHWGSWRGLEVFNMFSEFLKQYWNYLVELVIGNGENQMHGSDSSEALVKSL